MKSEVLKNSTYDPLYETFEKLAKAINFYLSYLELVAVPESDKKPGQIPHFITESAVRLPISEYLERRAGVSNLILEYLYPNFYLKRCDFSFEVGTSNPDVCLAELKYAKSSVNCQDYFDDLLRLHFAKIGKPKKRCFFIVCGPSDHYVSIFKNKTISGDNNTELDICPENKYYTPNSKDRDKREDKKKVIEDNWLSFNSGKRKVSITKDLISPYWDLFESTHSFTYDPIQKKKCERRLIKPLEIETM